MTARVRRLSDLERIHRALAEAGRVLGRYTPGQVDWVHKSDRGDELTAADEAVDRVLRDVLPDRGEGWLSEESRDDRSRLDRSRVWIVDPLDGTREFVEGVPEWCVSIGLVEDGRPVAGGIFNPETGQVIVGAVETGVTLNGVPVRVTEPGTLRGARVLASRSEVRRGEWERFRGAEFETVPCGSVAYKLGLVAAGLADATFTLVPKSEWDVAAGVALVRAAGGRCVHRDGSGPAFNKGAPILPDLLAGSDGVVEALRTSWLAATR